MKNFIFNLFQKGNNTQVNNHVTIYNAKIDTSLKRLEKDFHDGNIIQAIDDLESLLTENKLSPEICYQLYTKKTSFLFSLRRDKEALDLLEYIEKEYKKFLDVTFEELKLISFSINKDKENFFELVNKIKVKNSKSTNIENFQLMYYLNSGNADKAKEVFETIDEELKNIKEIALMGGHIYSSLDDYSNTDKFYTIALAFDISFLEKTTVYGFYVTNLINKLMHGTVVSENYKEMISEYKELIKKILGQSEYFEKSYIKNLKNIFLHLFIIVDDLEGYINFYEQESNDEFIDTYHYFQYVHLKKIPIAHKKVQDMILKGNKETLLKYAQSLEQDNNEDELEIINFLENNFEFIYSNQFVLFFYTQWKIKNSSNLDKDFIDYLTTNKYENFEYLISYINFLKNTKTPVATEDIDKLLEFAYNEKNIFARILNTLHILKDLGKRKEYLELVLNKESTFKYIISEGLELCYKDKNLLMDDFSYFVNNIGKQNLYYSAISDVYLKYSDYKLSFDFLFKEFQENSESNALLLGLLQISLNHFFKTKDVIEKEKQQEVYQKLISRKDDLSIYDMAFLLQYSIIILKDTKQILPFLNQNLLKTDINSLEEAIKIDFSNLFTQTLFGLSNYEDLFIYDDNLCLVKEDLIYVKNNHFISEDNSSDLGFISIDDNQFFLMKQDKGVTQESLFHRIVGTFALYINNPNHIPMRINTKSDNPLSEMFTFLEKQKKGTIDLFERYSNKEYFGLFALVGHEYKNYFTLIPYLLNHKKYYLNSLQRNFIADRKKILTLSSIVFLNEIGYLEEVLQRKDIVIQQTLINWMKEYINKFNYSLRPREYFYLDDSEAVVIPYTDEEFQESIISLITKLLQCEIIDDTLSNLPIGEAYEILEHIGSQEYHALAYYIENNYQIISENNIFEMMFSNLKYNEAFIGNSLGLLETILDDTQIYELTKILYEKKYRPIFNCIEEYRLIKILHDDKFQIILNEQLIFKFRIWYDYGCLDNIIKKYTHIYKVLYPKTVLPIEDTFSKNVEFLLSLIIDNK